MKSNQTILRIPDDTNTAPQLRIVPYSAVKIATITLNRPEHANRITSVDIASIRSFIQQINIDLDIRAMILTAAVPNGRKVFSAGFDIREFERDAGPAADNAGFEALADAIYDMRPLTIAVIPGDIYGGATDLALACDFRIGVHDMVLKMPAAELGLHYYANGLKRAVRTLGLSTTKRLFLTAQTLNATDLFRLGWLDECVGKEELEATTQSWINTITRLDPLAVEGMKRTVNEIANDQFDRETAFQRIKACHLSEGFQNNLLKFRSRK